jgi:hypothetical protein
VHACDRAKLEHFSARRIAISPHMAETWRAKKEPGSRPAKRNLMWEKVRESCDD